MPDYVKNPQAKQSSSPVSDVTTTRLAHIPTAVRNVCLYKSNIREISMHMKSKMNSFLRHFRKKQNHK